MKKKLPSVEHVETLSLGAMRRLVGGLVDELHALKAEVVTLRSENEALRDDNAQLRLENTRLKVDNQLLRDEIARLKNLPPRPPFRPSGMEKATEPKAGNNKTDKKKPRGAKRDQDKVTHEEIVRADVPQGSRFKGYKSCFVRELVMQAELVHYRRECWVTPDGRTVIAPMPAGITGGYGSNLRRFCLVMHAQGQVTT
ncbi:cell division protein ZapB, partial [Phyllobacterium sophorae]